MRDYFDWVKEAACDGLDLNLFFPTRDQKSTKEIRRLCEEVCPVQMDCLQHAVIYNEDGVWGGRTKRYRTRHYPQALRALLIHQAKEAGIYHGGFSTDGQK